MFWLLALIFGIVVSVPTGMMAYGVRYDLGPSRWFHYILFIGEIMILVSSVGVVVASASIELLMGVLLGIIGTIFVGWILFILAAFYFRRNM